MTLPERVVSALSDSIYARRDADAVEAALGRLGAPVSATFREFYRRYRGTFGSNVSGFELLDLCETAPSVISVTELCRELHGFPLEGLVLTELYVGSVLVYGGASDAVFDVDFEGSHAEFIAGQLEPEWPSFAAFLEEYFS